jgi:hypothetical protein
MMIMEQPVERGLAGETEVVGKNLSQCHFIHHKSHVTLPGIEPGPPNLPYKYVYSVINIF